MKSRVRAVSRPAVFLMGPTAVGKTAIAVELVARLPLEIISVDSAMVYRGMDIGTGKPHPDLLARAPHRLIDICDPAQTYSAARFVADALDEMDDIIARGRVPLLVGGTGLYFRALAEGLSPLPGANPQVRAHLDAEARVHGWAALHDRLKALDPVTAARVHPNDPQRIQRALEVFEVTGRTMTELISRAGDREPIDPPVKIVLERGHRAELHDRIARRFRHMLAQGLVDEVGALRLRDDLHARLPSMRAVGYRQVWEYLDGNMSYEGMVDKAIVSTRRLARRQITWLRSEAGVLRLDAGNPKLQTRIVNHLSVILS